MAFGMEEDVVRRPPLGGEGGLDIGVTDVAVLGRVEVEGADLAAFGANNRIQSLGSIRVALSSVPPELIS